MKMRKIALSAVLLLSLCLPLTIAGLATASPGFDFRWKEPFYHGSDEFYGGYTIYAYSVGSKAVCDVQISNDKGQKANVTVHLEIFAQNQTSDEQDVDLEHGEESIFTISFDVPSASNLFRHHYRFFVKYNTTHYVDWDIHGYYHDFVVYSGDQADARDLRTELGHWSLPYTGYYGVVFMQSAEAWELSQMASAEEDMGDEDYMLGNFGSAEIHYERSLNYTMDAISAFASTSSTFEDAMVSLFTSGSGLMNFYGIAFLVGGIGFLLMGIGVIVYLVRRSKQPASPT
jgi:hypothetical protein